MNKTTPSTNTLEVALSGNRKLILSRSFHAPRKRVWACHTRPDLVRRWLLGPPGWTMPTCEIDLRVGGRYRYVWRDASGVDMGMSGVFRELVAPEWLVTSQQYDADWTGGETVVTQRFAEAGGVTLLTMTVLYSSAQAREGALRTGMTTGMEMSYSNLDSALVEPGLFDFTSE